MTLRDESHNLDKEKIMLYTIITIGILIRIFMAYWHFTHVDDVGVMIQYLLQNQSTNEIKQGFVLARGWTYAPLQGIFTSLFVNNAFSYRLNIFMSRFPSCILGITSIIVLLELLHKMNFDKNRWLLTVFCAFFCFSWENIIYSAQAEPYEIIVFFGLLILLSAYQRFYENWKTAFLYLIVFTLGCYGHYQFFVLIFCYYIASFICNIKNKNNLIRICSIAILNFILTLPLIYFFITANKINNGLNWNRGLGDQFLLSFSSDNFVNNIGHFLKFFAYNTFYLYKYFFTIDSFDIISNVFAFVLLVTAVIGFLFVHKNNKMLAIFSDVLILITVILVLKQKQTFGPSRHCLYLYPMLLLFLCNGFLFIINFFNKFGRQNISVLTLKMTVLLLTISFAFSLPREIGNRKNLFNEKEIETIAKEYLPSYIYGTAWTPDICGMKINGYEQDYYWIDRGLMKQSCNSDVNNHTYMIINRCLSIEDLFNRKNDRLFYHLEKYNDKFVESNYPNFQVIYKKEIPSTTEIEYAQKYYNFPNGIRIYIIKEL